MKMIRRTSRTSMSGVTLMSDWSPPPPPTCIPMVAASPSLAFLSRRDETDLLEADLLHLHTHLLDVPVGQPRVALEDDRGVLVALVLLGDPGGELRIVGIRLFVDVHDLLVVHRDQDLRLLLRLLRRIGRPRHR